MPYFLNIFVTIFVVKSISFQLLFHLTFSDSRLYFVSVLRNISVSVSLNENTYISFLASISVNKYKCGRKTIAPSSYIANAHN